ncbi:uncharacterized protein LOC143249222 [Tachypleus tridentatus]|uniref:uncharacterized protein LOC143249222 n=1 Tax=Tachypleus tridentatus TaxID=6853 RepID=UPI003FD48292
MDNSTQETIQQPEVSAVDQDVAKTTSTELNKSLLRCLLLVLPVAIPVVIYLQDVPPTRRIFLTTFGLLLVAVFSCMLMTLLRAHQCHLEEATPHIEVTREFPQHCILPVTNRSTPDNLYNVPSTGGMHDVRSGVPLLHSYTHAPVHYHLSPHYHNRSSPHEELHSSAFIDSPVARSPFSSQHLRSSSLRQPSYSSSFRHYSSRSSHHQNMRSSSPYRTYRSFRRHSSSSPRRIQSASRLSRSCYDVPPTQEAYTRDQTTLPVAQPCVSRSFFTGSTRSTQLSVRDDPPSYEVALYCPLALVCNPLERAANQQAETPPPSYDKIIK